MEFGISQESIRKVVESQQKESQHQAYPKF